MLEISKMPVTRICWCSTTSPTSCPSTMQLHLCSRIQYFRDSIIFMHKSRVKGEGCLVHCVAGVSRSVTLVVAYIMTVTGHGWVESLAAVRAARPCARPNLGFLRQLEEFENTKLEQHRTWWNTHCGKHSLHDEEEVRQLLMRGSKDSTSDFPNSITKSLAISGS
ncbi:dual specificity protein phosphatase 22-B-like isoform X3 [Nerophis ophidion]|nr:dual specificity protein phosphatase 22-B-like isoform X3 [Nerophis ophidion]